MHGGNESRDRRHVGLNAQIYRVGKTVAYFAQQNQQNVNVRDGNGQKDAAPKDGPWRKNTNKVDRQVENVVIGSRRSTTGKVLTNWCRTSS